MAKPKIVNQKAKWRAHSIRLVRYAERVQSVYDTLSREVARLALKTGYDGDKPFKWSDYPATKEKFDKIRIQFVKGLREVIYSGTSEEWKQSNLIQDLLADKALKFYGIKRNGKKAKVYYQTNNDALKAFQERKDKGMNLSQKLWNQSASYKTEMEYCLSSAIEKGMSAVKLSKKLSKYLLDYPLLKKDYKEKYGKAIRCQDCEYRSIRLARSEINMAYRSAEQERWKQFDFVLGYEVKLTQNGRHIPDICDDLVGKYPKDFKFVGWHPNCLCYTVPVLKTEEQFFNYEEAPEITEPPQGFSDWLKDNAKRIDKAAERGTLPYWYKDNSAFVKGVKSVENFDILALPKGLPEKYRQKFMTIRERFEAAEKELPEWLKRDMRYAQVELKKAAELLANKEKRTLIENRYGGSFDRILDNWSEPDTLLEIRKMGDRIAIEMSSFDRDFSRPALPYRTPVLLPKSDLPCNMKKISELLNSVDSLERFYINSGYRSYEEFFNELGGIPEVEKKLKSLADNSRVYMCIDGGVLEKKIIRGDGKFKNSLEIGKGTFKTIGDERAKKERVIFGLSEDSNYDVMPKYGFVAGRETMDYEPIVGFGYGDTYVRFKDTSVRNRTTISCGDSYDGNKLLRDNKGYSQSTPITSLERPDANFALGLPSLQSSAIGEAAMKRYVDAKKLSDLQSWTYVEAQIYGIVRIEDVDAIFVSSKKRMASLSKFIKKQGLDIEILPCKYDTRLKLLENGFADYDGKAAKYAISLTDDDVDVLGEFYIDGLCKKFAVSKGKTPKSWESLGDEFLSDMEAVKNGEATSAQKRRFLKSYYAEIRKKDKGVFSKGEWREYSPSYGGWTSDVLNEKLLHRSQ